MIHGQANFDVTVLWNSVMKGAKELCGPPLVALNPFLSADAGDCFTKFNPCCMIGYKLDAVSDWTLDIQWTEVTNYNCRTKINGLFIYQSISTQDIWQVILYAILCHGSSLKSNRWSPFCYILNKTLVEVGQIGTKGASLLLHLLVSRTSNTHGTNFYKRFYTRAWNLY